MSTVLDSVTIERAVDGIAVGVVLARGCITGPDPAGLSAALDAAIAEARSRQDTTPITAPVRDMLRHGRYKPTGRGKPASEYLLQAALEDRFPRINNLVDINNLISLRSLLPISLVDLVRAGCDHFTVRHGRPSESYIFNAGGQTIDLEDLLLVARLPGDEACANPIKDSMATKIDDSATDVMAVLYAPDVLRPGLSHAVEAFEEALKAWGGAARTARALV
jgi:DNA/RNA-binding domain of Phe-tRNA-synthetase-like protein